MKGHFPQEGCGRWLQRKKDRCLSCSLQSLQIASFTRFKWFLTKERRGGLIFTAMWPHTLACKKWFRFSSFHLKTMPDVDACTNQSGLRDDIADDFDDDSDIMNKASTPLEQLSRAFSSNMVTTSSSSTGFSTTFPYTSFQFWAFLWNFIDLNFEWLAEFADSPDILFALENNLKQEQNGPLH